MPAIRLFNRKWKVGSDDFVFPMLGENSLRLVWFVGMLAVLVVHRNDLSSCKNGFYLQVYYTGMLILVGINIFFSFLVMKNSMKGNILDEDKVRRLVPCMVTGKLIFLIPEIGWICLGTALLFSFDLSACPGSIVLALQIVIGCCWFFALALIILILVIFDPIGNPSEHSRFSQASRIWKLRCKFICCCTGQDGDESDSFEEISKIMAEYFYGTELIMTDIAAGLVLLNEEQRRKKHCYKRELLTPYANLDGALKPLGVSDAPEDWMNLANARHFMKFALACYGWLFFVYDKICLGPGRLCCAAKVSSRGLSKKVHGDSCCFCNTNAILQQTGIEQKDIMYANFENKLYEIPFYIATDHEFKAIVVAVRGTLSFYDAITDLTIESQDMEIDFVTDAKAHKGILQAATNIKKKIVENNLLKEAFDLYPNYRLVVTGHSLGAGAASILSILLKPLYPNLMCFSYSPPGWLVSLPLCHYAEDFICSVVVGKDLVPRLGVPAMNILKNDLFNAIRNSKRPKYKILFKIFLRTFCCRPFKTEATARDQSDDHLLPENSSNVEIPSCSSIDGRISILDNLTPLYLPGKILYLEKESTIRSCCQVKNIYRPFWAQREFFKEILVSPKMVSEHKPDVVYKALKSITL